MPFDAPTASREGRSLRGHPIPEAAAALGIAKPAFVALCEHHDILALHPYGGRQKRRFITTAAERAGLGWNVIPPTRSTTRRTGAARFWPFAVFDPARLDDLAWILGWPNLLEAVAALPSREERRGYLLTNHAYLPDAIIGDLSGYVRSAVQKARSASRRATSSPTRRHDLPAPSGARDAG